jgi:hypothetical protein
MRRAVIVIVIVAMLDGGGQLEGDLCAIHLSRLEMFRSKAWRPPDFRTGVFHLREAQIHEDAD